MVLGAETVLLVLFFNVAEFTVFPWPFPEYGPLATFSLAGLGCLAVLAGVAVAPFSGERGTSLVAFGVVLLVGFVPTYLLFGCVFYGCVGGV